MRIGIKTYLLSVLMVASCYNLFGQENNKPFSFAKTYFGIDLNFVPSYGKSKYLKNNGQTTNFSRSPYISPSINIGATHFWGYADIYVSITTTTIFLKKDKIKTKTKFGAFTGFRIYPLRLKNYGISPYIGYKFSPIRYNQNDLNNLNFKTTNIKSTLDIGVGYQLPNLYCYLGYNKILNPETDIYISRTVKAKTTIPSTFFNAGINLMIETTKSNDNKVNRHFNDKFSKSNRNGVFFGCGPSSTFQIGSSDYNLELYPFLDDKPQSRVFPDLSMGYHFIKPDFITSIAFRPMTQKREAFNFSQTIKRKSFVLETYKFIGDYHGFCPFIGGGLSYENLKLKEVDNGVTITDRSQNSITPVITFGWDIRPSKKGDWWLLRTNLRYSPSLKFEHLNKNISLKQLEFNFIQFIIYPQRLSKYKKIRKLNRNCIYIFPKNS